MCMFLLGFYNVLFFIRVYSCRNESDYLYKEELNGYLTTGTLTHLRVAMSRGMYVFVLIYILTYGIDI